MTTSTTDTTAISEPAGVSEKLTGLPRVFASVIWATGVALGVVVFLRFILPYHAWLLKNTVAVADLHAFVRFGISPHIIAAFVAGRDVVVVAVFVVVALIILRRGMDSPLILFVSLTLVVSGAMIPRTLDAPVDSELWPVLATLVRYMGQALFIVFLYVFPDGRCRPRWTRAVVALWIAAAAVFFVIDVFWPTEGDWPIRFERATQLVWLVGGLAAQVWRYRSVSDPTQRQQTKWVVWGFAFLVLGVVCVNTSRVVLTTRFGHDLGLAYYDLVAITFCGAIPVILFPLTIAVSILRNRLWDLETYVNRGLLYVTLTILLALILFASLAVFQAGFHALIGQDSDLAILASALVIAALAQPLRRRLQSAIDHTLYRSRVNTEHALMVFGRELRTMVDLGQLVDELLIRSKRLLGVRQSAVFLVEQAGVVRVIAATDAGAGESGGDLYLDDFVRRDLEKGFPVMQSPDSRFAVLAPLTAARAAGNELVGVLALGPRVSGKGFSNTDIRILMEFAGQAGIAIHVATLSRAVREGEELYRRLVETSPNAIFLTDVADGRIQICNEQAMTLFGASNRGQLLGRTLISFVPKDERQRAIDLGVEALETGFLRNVEYTMLTLGGTPFPLELSGSLLRSEDGRPTGFVAILRDITGRKIADEEIRRLNEELEQRVIDRTRQLEEANRELGAFAYSVSHDLRAPLRSIDGFGELLMDEHSDRLSPEGRETVDRMRSASRRMGRLIDDLLTMSRISRREILARHFDMSDQVRQIAAELQAGEPERHVEFIIADGVTAYGDRNLLRVLLENLVENAWKFTGGVDSPRIEFATEIRDGETVYTIRDNGAGFEMEFVDKVFEPFQRLHSQNEFPGTGIGLATVERIVNRHKGNVWAEGAVGSGATLYFTLKLDPSDPDA